MNKQGGFTDFFLFMIIAFVVVLIMGVFIFVVTTTNNKLHEKMDTMEIGSEEQNVTQVIDNTIGKVRQSYYAFYWLSVLLIVGMIISIFIGSYMVTTKPIFFIPYIFLTIIAVIVSVGISNGYELVINDPTMASTFSSFTGANWIMLKLPIWITVIGFVGAIIMFSRLGKKEETYGY